MSVDHPTDIITKVPSDLGATITKPPDRVKDPKKVAAGRALAKKNREGREALKKMEAMEQSREQASASPLTFSDANGWLVAAAGVAGGCLTLYHTYNLFFPAGPAKPEKDSIDTEDVTPTSKDPNPEALPVVKSGDLIDME